MSTTTTTPELPPPPTETPPDTTTPILPPPPPPPSTSDPSPPPDTTTPSTPIILPPPDTSTSSTTSTSSALPTDTSTTSTTTTSSTTTPQPNPTPNLPPVETSTSTVVAQGSLPPVAATNTADSSSGGTTGFFHNTGAVAGVFTVVGLIVLAILIALITNSIRRRRARKFDDEIAAAARDAANTQVPNFGYEDDDHFRPGGYGAGAGNTSGTKFSDASHGTYAQPPMSVPESYGMRELPQRGPGLQPGEYFDAGGYGPAGAAGIGVARARSMRDGGYAAALNEGASPYAAFAAPNARNGGSVGRNPQYPPGMIPGGAPEFDLSRRPSQYTQPSDYSGLTNSKSMSTVNSTSPSYHSYGQGQPAQGQGYPNSFGAFATSASPPPKGGASSGHLPAIPSSRSEENLDSAYDGYVDESTQMPRQPATTDHNTHGQGSHSPVEQLPNPFSASKPEDYADETDDEVEEPRRILKVANE